MDKKKQSGGYLYRNKPLYLHLKKTKKDEEYYCCYLMYADGCTLRLSPGKRTDT